MRVAPRQQCLDKLSVTGISLNELDPRLFYGTRDYQSLWTLNFCGRNVGRQTQPTIL